MRMKKVLMMACALMVGASAVSAQETTLPQDGDLYQGLTRSITYDRMIPPHGLQVTFDKTVHIIFPASVTYVDLGSANIMAGKADGAENVIRVKATKRWFKGETNMSVITEDGSFYAFNVKYAKEPDKLNIEMKDFIHDGSAVNRPNNSMDIYLKELGSESPVLVRLVMKSIWKQNERIVKHIGSKGFGIRFLLKGIYTHNGLLYFHTEIKNSSNVPFDVDYVTWKIVDKKVVKRTAIQGLGLLFLGIYAILWQVILKKIPLNKAFLFKSMIVLFTLLIAYIFFKEVIVLKNIVGAALIITGIIINSNDVHP